MNKLLLIDGNSIMNRAFYGIPDMTTNDGRHTNAIYGFLNIILKVIEEEQATHICVAFDLKKKTFRHEMYEAYKGTRKGMPEELHEQMPRIKEILQAMHIRIVEQEGFEADDLIGTLSKKGEREGFAVTILSGDRDLLQLATDTDVGNLPNLFIVADGMGGHKAGDYASRYTIERVVASVSRNTGEEPIAIMKEAINKANELLVAESREDESKSGMGTTLVIGTIIGNKLFVANIGDSRLYVVGQNMRQITRDHSLVDEMVRLGEINADEARVHPDKNIITRAVGTSDHVEADFFEVEITADDTILLCTDGLTNMVRDDEILDIIKKYDNAQAATMQLVKEANANGGRDNITVMIIKPF
mgnify:CR=1 FL=1